MRYCFDHYELDTDTRRLTGPDGEIHIEPQVFDVLAFLAANRSRVVRKEEILDEVWESRFVSESALTSRIKAARAAVGDSGRQQNVIRTAHGAGYQFVAEVVDDDASRESPATPTARPRSLPDPGNEFRGREQELADVIGLVGEERLVTLLGPGGTGKTRLSIEVARAYPGDTPAVFVDLAAVRDDQALPQALAAALAIDSGVETDVLAACTAFLRASPTLLIIDNCEHVAEAATDLVSRLLTDAPQSPLLATSRVPLGVPAEALYRLQPLPVIRADGGLTVEDAADNAAIALFCDRARRVQHGFTLEEDSVADVAALCSSLDGLPLALELAAGRMGVFSVGDLLGRLDRRLDLLGDQRAGADARHRTLRATLNWSYELLDTACRRLFRFMSVFPGGLTLEGVEWLGERIELDTDPTLALEGLVESSLVGRSETASGTRYVLLETMRTFGTDLLTASDEHISALDLAAQFALSVTGDMEQDLDTPREEYWNDRIRRELPNIREARLHLRDTGRIGDLIQISASLDEYARLRDVSEAWAWCDELGELTVDGDEAARVDALRALAAWRRGRIDQSEQLAQSALDQADDDWVRARGLSALGVSLLFQGRLLEAAETWDARVAIDDHVPDAANAILCRAYAGIEGARAEIDALRARVDRGGHGGNNESWVAYVTGEIAATRGDADSIEWLERAIDQAQEVGTAFTVGVAGVTLCTATAARGDVPDAARLYRDLIEHWLRSGTWTQQWTTLRNAAVLLEPFDAELALTIIDAADADPYAPGLDEAMQSELSDMRTRLAAATGDDAPRQPPDRSELARQTRAALALVMRA